MRSSKKNTNLFSYTETFFTSLITGSVALWIVYLLSGLVILYFSYDFNIQAHFNLAGIHFVTPDTNPLWTRDAIITIFLSKVIFCFFNGLFFMLLFVVLRRKSSSLSLFLLWMMVFSFANAFGTFIVEGLMKGGIYKVSQMLHVGTAVLVIVGAISLYLLYLSGVIVGKLILLNTKKREKRHGQLLSRQYLFSFIFPWIGAILLFVLTTGSAQFSQTTIFLMGMIILLPVLWVKPSHKGNFRLKPPHAFNLLDGITLLLLLALIYLIYLSLKQDIVLPLV